MTRSNLWKYWPILIALIAVLPNTLYAGAPPLVPAQPVVVNVAPPPAITIDQGNISGVPEDPLPDDPPQVTTPEPSSVIIGLCGLLVGGAYLLYRRKRMYVAG